VDGPVDDPADDHYGMEESEFGITGDD
jgi:hypothetical protein